MIITEDNRVIGGGRGDIQGAVPLPQSLDQALDALEQTLPYGLRRHQKDI